MTQKLINAITVQIDEIFQNSTIYTNHIKQNFKNNSFFIRIIQNSEKPYLANRFKLFNKIEILYTPEEMEDKIKQLNYVSQSLFENMKYLKFEDGFICAENMQANIKDEKLFFQLEYNFYIFRFDEVQKMNKLFMEGDTKCKKTMENTLKKNF